jgi:hypothetical protein
MHLGVGDALQPQGETPGPGSRGPDQRPEDAGDGWSVDAKALNRMVATGEFHDHSAGVDGAVVVQPRQVRGKGAVFSHDQCRELDEELRALAPAGNRFSRALVAVIVVPRTSVQMAVRGVAGRMAAGLGSTGCVVVNIRVAVLVLARGVRGGRGLVMAMAPRDRSAVRVVGLAVGGLTICSRVVPLPIRIAPRRVWRLATTRRSDSQRDQQRG